MTLLLREIYVKRQSTKCLKYLYENAIHFNKNEILPIQHQLYYKKKV